MGVGVTVVTVVDGTVVFSTVTCVLVGRVVKTRKGRVVRTVVTTVVGIGDGIVVGTDVVIVVGMGVGGVAPGVSWGQAGTPPEAIVLCCTGWTTIGAW